ncbi:peptidoglycan recognition family protein [Nocardiopsis sp. MG754419]|uniref:peptidoglycan recognition protein family protein n=1 Tax=Nocardiopsis sp. MG754419 TaxID=2259865 RepID=UPI001BACDAC1|nr:peptidoglycan recognition family protein [Nocardiopsis sp. MG754419]MBR8745328.1 N-acetylmuramoyl-L-alanine amidase [Nocardiopsis sp. MG754419]
MRRRTLLTTATAAAGLSTLAPALVTPAAASAATSGARTAPRVLTETTTATDAPAHPARRFDLVAVARPPERTSAAVRFERADGWGAWQDLHFHTEGPDHLDPVSTAVARAPEGATGYQVRGADGADLTALNLRDGEDVTFGGRERVTLSAEGDEYRTLSGTSALPLRTRAGWGADESLRFDEDGTDLWPAEFHRVQALTVHHTAWETTGDHAADVRAVYAYHAAELGWGDIGYHLLIDPEGVVYEGRHSGEDGVPVFSGLPRPGEAASVTAGHAAGFNHANIGVCLLGDFTDELPTRAAQDSLVAVLRVLCALTGVNPAQRIEYVNPATGAVTPQEAVARHRDWLATECPGNAFAAVFDSAIRARVVRGWS